MGVRSFLQTDDIDAEGVELVESAHEGMCRSGEAVIPPHKHNVRLAASDELPEACEAWAIVVPAGSVIGELV